MENKCPCCGKKIKSDSKKGQLVRKSQPTANVGAVVYIQNVKYYICECKFVLTYIDLDD